MQKMEVWKMSAKMSTKKKKSFTAKPGSYTFRKKVTPWCILFLPMAFTVWLKYYPIFSAFYISLFKYDPINPPGRFVGLKNYLEILLFFCSFSCVCAFLSL